MKDAKNPVELAGESWKPWKRHGLEGVLGENVVEKRVVDAGVLRDIREIHVPVLDLHSRGGALIEKLAALSEEVGDEGFPRVFLLGFDEIEDLDGGGVPLEEQSDVSGESAVERVVSDDLDGRSRHGHADVLFPVSRDRSSELCVRSDVSENVLHHGLHLHFVRHKALIVEASLQIPRSRVHPTAHVPIPRSPASPRDQCQLELPALQHAALLQKHAVDQRHQPARAQRRPRRLPPPRVPHEHASPRG